MHLQPRGSLESRQTSLEDGPIGKAPKKRRSLCISTASSSDVPRAHPRPMVPCYYCPENTRPREAVLTYFIFTSYLTPPTLMKNLWKSTVNSSFTASVNSPLKGMIKEYSTSDRLRGLRVEIAGIVSKPQHTIRSLHGLSDLGK